MQQKDIFSGHFVLEVIRKTDYTINNKRKRQTNNRMGGKDMAVLAKPINRIAVVKKQESQKFVREFNENKVTNEFLDSCKKAGKLFGNRK